MKDLSLIDTSVFTLDDPSSPLMLSTYTEDATKVDTYEFTINLTTPDYPMNPGASKDFSILIQKDDKCLEANIDITPGTPLQTLEYYVGSAAFDTQSFADFTVQPAYCEISYETKITPALVAPDDSAITFDSLNNKFTISTSNIGIVGDYTIRVTAVTPPDESVDTDIGWDWVVQIKSPCIIATLSIDPTIVPSPYSYIASQA